MPKIKKTQKKTFSNSKSLQKDSAYLKKELKHLNTIFNITKDVNVLIEMENCYKAFVDKLCNVFNANIASLMLIDHKKDELIIEAASGLKEEIIKQAKIRLGEGIAGWVAKELKPLLVKDINDFPHFKNKPYKSVTKYNTNSLLSVPLIVKNDLVGVLNITDKKNKKKFSQDDLDLLVDIAKHVAISARNSRKYRQLARLNEEKSRAISNIAHELKSPLATIREGINLVTDGILGDVNEKQKKSLGTSLENINRLVRMINDLLDISKIEAGRFTMKRSLVDLNALINKAYEFFEPLANKSSIQFKLTLPKDSIRIWADHDKIFEVISNLVSNAIKYNVRGGSVNIVVFDKDNEVVISVKDTGCGIAGDDIPKIFQRYGGLHFSKDKNIDSTGLGLSITKEIVDLHRGRIEVESQLGRGSDFILSLPIDLRAAR